jgi:putative ABC transport system substrate-binding protein
VNTVPDSIRTPFPRHRSARYACPLTASPKFDILSFDLVCGDRMLRRREFISLFAGATAAWPLGARAQESAKLPTIGFLGANTQDSQSQWTAAFVQRLRELGWSEGRNIAIAYRWADGRADRSAEIAAEFAQLKVDVIATSGTPMALAAKRATSTTPIVFATAGDPVGTGLVRSLAQPGGNVTGLSVQQIDLGSKRVELLRELVPDLRRLAVMANVGSPDAVRQLRDVDTTVNALGLQFVKCELKQIEDVASVIDGLKSRAEALYVISDPLLFSHRDRVNVLAMSIRLPTIHSFRDHVETGGSCLMCRTIRPCFGVPPTSLTRFCAGRSRATFPSNSRLSSSLSST